MDRRTLAFIVVATGLALVGTSASAGAPITTAAAASVDIINYRFVDDGTATPVTAIHAGDSVTWTWVAYYTTHTATQGVRDASNDYGADEPLVLGGFYSGAKYRSFSGTQPTYTFTFTEAGVFPYFCAYHDEMEGVVVVAP